MSKRDTARKIYETAHLTGEFTLRSGQISNEYFDKYLFEAEPGLLADIAAEMRALIPEGSEIHLCISQDDLDRIRAVTPILREYGNYAKVGDAWLPEGAREFFEIPLNHKPDKL